MIITGSSGVFTAGNDLKDFLDRRQRSQKQAFGASGGEIPATSLGDNNKPLVAAVDGVAVGIGTTMMFHCDYVIASKAALFSTPFVGLGLVPEGASSLLMPRALGHQRAFALLVMGRSLDGEAAREAGFVNEVVAPGHVESRSAQGRARDLRAAAGSGRDVATAAAAAAGNHTPSASPSRASFRRAHAIAGGPERLQGIPWTQGRLTTTHRYTHAIPFDSARRTAICCARRHDDRPGTATRRAAHPRDQRFSRQSRPAAGGIRISDPARRDEEDRRPGRRLRADGDAGASAAQRAEELGVRRGRRSDRRKPVAVVDVP